MNKVTNKPQHTRTALRTLQAEVQSLKREVADLKPQKQADMRQTPNKRNIRLIALLETFEAGDAEQQRRDLAQLQSGLDAARPGQRSIFGEGLNP